MIESAFPIITTTDLPRSELGADQPWRERTARVTDPDGNVVMVGARSH